MGVSVSNDGFGTLHSLSFIKNLPIDRVKIAKSFIKNLSVDPCVVVIAQLWENF